MRWNGLSPKPVSLQTLLLLGILSVVVTAVPTRGQETMFAKVNQTFQVSLPENPTTGFQWEASFDQQFMILQSKRYVPDQTAAAGRRGAGGTAIFSFIPLKQGNTTLVLLYKRSWEKKVAEEKSIHVNITD